MNLKDLTKSDPILAVIVELVEVQAVLRELERAQVFLRSDYYWGRKEKKEKRQKELFAILNRVYGSETFAKPVPEVNAPDEQYLLSKTKEIFPSSTPIILKKDSDLFQILADVLSSRR